MMEYQLPIGTSALHIYYSAVPLALECQLLAQPLPEGNGLPSLLFQRMKQWNPMLAYLEGHSHFVLSLAISPNGLRIASGSRDSTIRVWDA
jgi:WD40 repeat protein